MSLVPHKDDPDHEIYKKKGLKGLEEERAKRVGEQVAPEPEGDGKTKKGAK